MKEEERQRIDAALRAIADAQSEVTAAITETGQADRADKRHASDRLRTALDRLRAAQTELSGFVEQPAR
jgi:hypothetical protein